MAKRVMWKKGMRLTDDILALSDRCTEELVSKGFLLGACGRIGLIPSTRNFSISLDINSNVIDVVSIDCIGLTRNGRLVDVQYDTNYTNSFDTRVVIPSQGTERRYYLCITAFDGVRDTNDGMCETQYGFMLVEENTPVLDSSLPVARILYDEFCWRSDEKDFVPPCLFVSSHSRYEELAQQFIRSLREINSGLPQNLNTESKDAVKIFWPSAQQILISMDKELDTMTPMEFLGNIQKMVSAFYTACNLDDYVTINDPAQYLEYINTPCDYSNIYETIRQGVHLSYGINEKIKAFSAVPVKRTEDSPLPPPSIEQGQLRQTIKFGNAKVKITNNAPGSTIYYTVDGTMPNQSSKSGNTVIIESGFTDNWHKEPPKNVTIKVVAYKDGTFSEVETYNVQVRKGNPFTGREI